MRQVGAGPGASLRHGAGAAVYGDTLVATASGGLLVDSLARKSHTGHGIHIRAPLVRTPESGRSATLERVLSAETLATGYVVNSAATPVTQCTLPSALALARALGVRTAPAYFDVVVDNVAASAAVVWEVSDSDSSVVFAPSFSAHAVAANDVQTLRFAFTSVAMSRAGVLEDASAVVTAWGAGGGTASFFDGELISTSATALTVGRYVDKSFPVFTVDASTDAEAGIVVSRSAQGAATIDTRGEEPLELGCTNASVVRIGAPIILQVPGEAGPVLEGYRVQENGESLQCYRLDPLSLTMGTGADTDDGSSLSRTLLTLRRVPPAAESSEPFTARLSAETGLELRVGDSNEPPRASLSAAGLTLGDASMIQTRINGPLRASHPCVRAYSAADAASSFAAGSMLVLTVEQLWTGYITLPAPTGDPLLSYASIKIPTASEFFSSLASSTGTPAPTTPMTFDFVVDVSALTFHPVPQSVNVMQGDGDVVAPEANMYVSTRQGVGHFRLSFNPFVPVPVGVLSRLDAQTPQSTLLSGADETVSSAFSLTPADSGATFFCDASLGPIDIYLPQPSPRWKFRFVSTPTLAAGFSTQAHTITFYFNDLLMPPKLYGHIVFTGGSAAFVPGTPMTCTTFRKDGFDNPLYKLAYMRGSLTPTIEPACQSGDYLELEGLYTSLGGTCVHATGIAVSEGAIASGD